MAIWTARCWPYIFGWIVNDTLTDDCLVLYSSLGKKRTDGSEKELSIFEIRKQISEMDKQATKKFIAIAHALPRNFEVKKKKLKILIHLI